ncbi:MAG: 2-oxo acid dehydrogenase subunit E2, partial [Ignavibacteriaceae bacterium]|nr:2-oxo acid dehydrogenase subunit E2 [Ignavibacteriaceae bacterium]
MVEEFKLPELGENITSADVLNVLIKPGDTIERDQTVIEIETDKATIEVPSTVDGVIKEVLVKSGDKINVGAVIFTVESVYSEEISGVSSTPVFQPDVSKVSGKDKQDGASVSPAISDTIKSSAPISSKEESATELHIVDFILPELGENIESADVLNVLVKIGEMITKDQGVIEIETDKATIEVPSTVEGKVVEINIKPGEKAKVGAVILKVEALISSVKKEPTLPKSVDEIPSTFKAEGGSSAGEKKTEPGEIDDQPPILKHSAPAAPSVRRIARELGVDIRKVTGSGSGGRISMDDVKAYVKRLNESRDALPSGGFGIKQEPLPDFTRFGSIERKPMSKIRTITAEHLSYAWNAVPHVSQFDKADITEVEKFRKSYGPKIEKAGGKLTITAILLKVISFGLKKYPQFNSSIDMEKKEIIYKKYFNIGVAVDTDHGLIVPVIKDIDRKNLTEISVELNSLAEKARTRKISLDEMQGGCFTITNLGGIGGTYFTPIINAPEVAILGVSRG